MLSVTKIITVEVNLGSGAGFFVDLKPRSSYVFTTVMAVRIWRDIQR